MGFATNYSYQDLLNLAKIQNETMMTTTEITDSPTDQPGDTMPPIMTQMAQASESAHSQDDLDDLVHRLNMVVARLSPHSADSSEATAPPRYESIAWNGRMSM